jgi:hypothetical protein
MWLESDVEVIIAMAKLPARLSPKVGEVRRTDRSFRRLTGGRSPVPSFRRDTDRECPESQVQRSVDRQRVYTWYMDTERLSTWLYPSLV